MNVAVFVFIYLYIYFKKTAVKLDSKNPWDW